MADCRSGVSATRPLTMVGASMPETKMDSAKSTSTPWKVFGRCCAPGCGRTAASRRRSCPTISPSSNSCTTPDVGAKPYSEPCWPPCCPPPRNPNRASLLIFPTIVDGAKVDPAIDRLLEYGKKRRERELVGGDAQRIMRRIGRRDEFDHGFVEAARQP